MFANMRSSPPSIGSIAHKVVCTMDIHSDSYYSFHISGLLLYAVIPVTINLTINSLQVNPRNYKCEVTSYYLFQLFWYLRLKSPSFTSRIRKKFCKFSNNIQHNSCHSTPYFFYQFHPLVFII